VKTKIDKIKDEIRSLERDLADLQSKKNSATDDSERRSYEGKISDKEREIKEKGEELKKFEGMISSWETQITEERKEVGNRLSTGKQCRDYRLDVQRAFAETKSYLERENSPEVKPHAEKIIRKIVDEERGH
jgi:predicted  nucleic acid-binding Zn-ribbon protein